MRYHSKLKDDLNIIFHLQIWLKDAVQCVACQMCCHKKCILKCQNATVCGSASDPASSQYGVNPEFKLTEVSDLHTPDVAPEELPDTGHRASIGDFIAQGLKRVNSANNLAIPALVSLSQSTKSLPPSPQQTPRRVKDVSAEFKIPVLNLFISKQKTISCKSSE